MDIVEKGDTVALKDGRSVEVLKVLQDYDKPGQFVRFDYVDNNEPSPMRRTAWPSDLLRILRKCTKAKLDPKAERPNDNPKIPPTDVNIVNKEAAPHVHPAVTKPAQPVLTRNKKDTDKVKG